MDLKAAHPAYQNSASLNLHFRRMHVNAVLLPDRTVLATGGSGKREDPALATLDCEIFDPNMRNWSLAAEAMIPRMYHSIALLLPDGRVVAAGSNPDKGSQANWVPADRLEELRLEIYSPPYLFRGKRPAITNAPAQVTLGEAFTVLTPDARSIQWISLIRPGLTTHSFNCEQRLADVPFQVGQETNSLSATMPKDPHIVPPGWYMLFLTNRQGIPSVASWVHISSGG